MRGCHLTLSQAVGDKVTGFHPDDEIFALSSFTRDGAAAQYQLVSAHDLAIKPASLTFQEAASIPLSALTAYQALFTHADVKPGQRILITGAGGGVGVMAVQIAAAAQLVITALCSSDKLDLGKDLGAHNVVDHRSTPISSLSHDFDMVLDTVGGAVLPQTFPLLKGNGQLISIARPPTADEKAQRPDVRATFFIVEPDGEELTRIAQCVEQEHVRPVVQSVFPLEEGWKAFELLESGKGKGKIVLQIDADEKVDSPQVSSQGTA